MLINTGKRVRIFLLSLFALLALGFAIPAKTSDKPDIPSAKNGVLDLRTWDLSGPSGILPLKGEWHFAWKQFLSPDTIPQENPFEIATVPHNWNGEQFKGEVSDGRGYGTYHLRILLPPNAPPLAIKSLGLTYAAALYVNGKLVHKIGEPSITKAGEKPYYMVTAMSLPPSASLAPVMDIVLHISNYHHARGGMITGLKFGAAGAIMAEQTRYKGFVIAMVSAMLALMAYCLLTYFTRPSFRPPLYFAELLLAAAAHLAASKGIFVDALPFISGQMFLRIEYLAVVAGPYAGFAFIASLYPTVFSTRGRQIVLAYSVLAAMALFLLDTYHFSTLALVYEGGMLLVVLASLVGLGIAVRRKMDDALFLSMGLGISFIGIAIGIAMHQITGAPSWLIVYATLTTSILAQAATLGRRISRAVRQTEELSEQLAQTNTHLETRVAERTKMLNKALDEAVVANQIKSDFLAAMSHEIRTPMNGVLGMTEAVLDGKLPAKQRENIQVVQQSAKALMVILNDILDISKIEAGKMTLERRAFPLKSVIDRAVSLWQQPVAQKGLELRTCIDDDPQCLLLGDEFRLGQVLSNLLSNACKFTQSGHVKLSVSLRDAGENIGVEIRIEDTGPGISRNKIIDVFTPFSQEDQSVSRRHGGTGLGLSISTNLVKLMGGTLKYDSTYEEGAAFVLNMRMQKAKGETKPEIAAPVAEKLPTKRLKLLIAEDNEINRKVMRAILQKMPFDLSFAHDGQEAVCMAEAELFDVILMDIQMPVMGGKEATKVIQSGTSANATTPIIAITANAMAGDKESYLAAGMCRFVSKPINPKDLIMAIIAATKDKKTPAKQTQKRA